MTRMSKKKRTLKVLMQLIFYPVLLYGIIIKKKRWSKKKKSIIAGGYTLLLLFAAVRIISSEEIDVSNALQLATSVSKTLEEDNTKLEIHFLDVGQALSVLITDGNGNDMLYDAGNEGDGDFIVNYLKTEGIDDLEYLINSHPHEDHLGGMDKVLLEYDVETVIMSNKEYNSKAYRDVISSITDKNIAVSDPIVGERYELGEAVIEILGPLGTSYDETNDYSVIAKVTIGNQSVLLVGDAEALSEHELVQSGSNLKANILQVGHHGSASSSTAQFLHKVKPDIAVISSGKGNKYGHPDNIVINRLEKMNGKVYRNDMQGTVVVTLNENEAINVATFSDIGN